MGGISRKRGRESTTGEIASTVPAKRRRSANEANLRLGKLYEHLAAEDEAVRLRAAKQIIVKFSPENGPSKEATETALQRLIRGLCSQRKAARLGFCITLTELLRQLFKDGKVTVEDLDLDVDGVVNMVEENTKVEGNVAGQERRDHAIGKLFGFKAVIQSSILFEPQVLLKSWSIVLDHICGMARDIPWLREECGMVLYEAVKSFQFSPAFENCVQKLIQRLVTFRLAHTPEGVAIWLLIQRMYSNVDLPDNIWHKNDPLGKKERSRLAQILKENFRTSPDASEEGTIKTAGANPNPIFAWDVVLSEMVQRDGRQASTKTDLSKSAFPQFWLDVVDNNLLSSSASHERKSWGFKLFSSLIISAPAWAIPSLFSPNLMRSLVNQSKNKDRFLHAGALAALKSVQVRAKQEPSSAALIFDALTSKNGIIDIDNVTKTRTLEQVVQSADDDALSTIVQCLQSLHLRPETSDEKMADMRRQCIGDIILNIVKGYQNYDTVDLIAEDKESWLKNALRILIDNAYFIPSRMAKTEAVPLPPVSDTTRKVYQERLSSCLSRLLRTGEEASSYAYWILGMIRSRPDTSDQPEMIFKAEDSVKKTIQKAFKTLESISKKGSKSGQKSTTACFILLYSVTLLQVFNDDGDAVLMLDDLDAARKSLLNKKDADEASRQDAFVEVILTLLGNERTLFRQIAEEAFTIFAADITADGLQSLIAVLDTPETLEGQRELFAQGDDEVGDQASDEMEVASDVEMVEGEAEDSDESSAKSDNDDVASESEEDEENEEEMRDFENKLALALQTSKPDMDGDDSDDADMDDDEMEALNPLLEQYFKQRQKSTSKKEEREDAKQNVVQFKSRVLDVLSSYLKKEYSNPLSLDMLLPLLRRIRAGNKQIAQKCMKILKAYCDIRAHHKAPLPKFEEAEPVWELLKAIHEEAEQGRGAKSHLDACSSASMHVVRVLFEMDMANYGKLSEMYKESQKEFSWDKKSVMVTKFQAWCEQKQLAGLIDGQR